MNATYDIVYQKLLAIYEVQRRRYKNNPDSKQMCCLWSTIRPPDILEGTRSLCAIEKAFDISLDEDLALEIYDMDLDEAARKIVTLLERNCLPK